jgi:hypothetical protein
MRSFIIVFFSRLTQVPSTREKPKKKKACRLKREKKKITEHTPLAPPQKGGGKQQAAGPQSITHSVFTSPGLMEPKTLACVSSILPTWGVRFLYHVDLFAPHPPILLGIKSQDLVRENAVQ